MVVLYMILLLLLDGSLGVHAKPSLINDLRIVGGDNAKKGEFPYMAALINDDDAPEIEYLCGGSILSEMWILTAAVCVVNTAPTDVRVLVGITKLSHAYPDGQNRYVKEFVLLNKGDITSESVPVNDVALISLLTPLTFDQFVQPIALQHKHNDEPTLVNITGWGNADHGAEPVDLQIIQVTTISNKECKQSLSSINMDISDTNICTDTKGHKGTCDYDEGSPVVAGNVQVGIVSGGKRCIKGKPDFHTRVSYFAETINKIISKHLP